MSLKFARAAKLCTGIHKLLFLRALMNFLFVSTYFKLSFVYNLFLTFVGILKKHSNKSYVVVVHENILISEIIRKYSNHGNLKFAT